jgi:drug/metabolite transporter (DMT)-like permease
VLASGVGNTFIHPRKLDRRAPGKLMQQNPNSWTYAAFAGAVVIGGANFIAVSFSNMELPPLFGATIRFALASSLLLLIGRGRGIPLARGRSAAGAAIYGILGFGVAYALLYYSLVGLAAGTVAVILAAVPLFTLVIATLLGQERVSIRGIAGGLLAIGGIAVLSLGTLGADLNGPYLLAAILAAVAAAGSSVIAKGLPDVHPVNMNAIGMAAGTVLLAIGSLALNEHWALPRDPASIMAVGWLVLLGSVGFFQLFLYVMSRWTASATVYALAAMPVVAVALGAVMLDQPITSNVMAGGALVIAAVYVGAVSQTTSTPRASPSRQSDTISEATPPAAASSESS